MVLYILTVYWVLGIVYLDQLYGAHHTHISFHDKHLLIEATVKVWFIFV